jgi:hypothetical protein
MKIREKFLKLFNNFFTSDEWEGSLEAELEKIADDYAIGFTDFVTDNCESNNSSGTHVYIKNGFAEIKSTRELLEIYKQTL